MRDSFGPNRKNLDGDQLRNYPWRASKCPSSLLTFYNSPTLEDPITGLRKEAKKKYHFQYDFIVNYSPFPLP